MALHALPAGLPPDEVEKLRWKTFGHRHSNALTSVDGLVRFITQRGFVLTQPQRGLHFPSALEAVVGRPLLGRSFDTRTSQLEAWRLRCLASRRLYAAAALEGRATLATPPFQRDFLALATRREEVRDTDRAPVRNVLGHDAAAICEHLARAGQPLSQEQLEERMQLRSDSGRTRLRQALAEAIRGFRVCEVVVPGASAEATLGYDLVARACNAVLEKAASVRPATARQRIATRYLRNVLVAGCHELARILGWSQADTLETLRHLESHKIAHEHPASRHNRWFFQANATDLLP